MTDSEENDPSRPTRADMLLPKQVFRRGAAHARNTAPQPGHAELRERLARFPPFTGLPRRLLDDIAGATRACAFHASETIWRQGEHADRALFIETGLAKTARRNSLGSARTYGLHGPGDSMGVYALCAGGDYPTDAVALSEGMSGLFVEGARLNHLAARHGEFSHRLLIEVGRFVETFFHKIEIVSAGSIERRLAVLMSWLTERYGRSDSDADGRTTYLPISLTLAHVAEIVDARIETVARVFSLWKRRGWLTMDTRGCVFREMMAIRALAAGT